MVVITFILVLPLVSGAFAYKVRKPVARPARSSDQANLTKRQKLKEKLDFSKDQSPVSIRLSTDAHTSSRKKDFEIDSKTGLKKRTIGKYSNDPNEFDYDLAELIEEDQQEEQREQELRYKQFSGREQQESEALV